MPNFKVSIKIGPVDSPSDFLTCSRVISAASVFDAYTPFYDLVQSADPEDLPLYGHIDPHTDKPHAKS